MKSHLHTDKTISLKNTDTFDIDMTPIQIENASITDVSTIPDKTPGKLRDHQIEHFHRLEKVVQHSFGYLDSSPTGSGKTYVTCEMAKRYGMSLLVVGPVSILPEWRKVASEFGVNVIGTLSYSMFRGVSGKVNHNFLHRQGKNYAITPYFQEWLKYRVLLVFDEVQNLKNKGTCQREAALTLVRAIISHNNGSRIALLSATPYDKDDLCESIILLLGLTKRNKLYSYSPRTRVALDAGITDVIKVCEKLDPKATLELDSMRGNYKTYPAILYSRVLKYHYSSTMPSPPIPVEQDIKNGFYRMTHDTIAEITQAQHKLRIGLNMSRNGEYEHNRDSFAIIQNYIQAVEKAKLSTLVRLAEETLVNNPQSKVILYVWYTNSVKWLMEQLSSFNPTALNGPVKPKDRPAIIAAFQEPSSKSRLLISHPQVGGVGISLDDRDGNWPRYVYAIPNYHYILLHQIAGRVYRTDTKSAAPVRYVYSRDNNDETTILNAIIRKAKTVTDSLFMGNESGYFNGHDAYYEPEPEFVYIPMKRRIVVASV